MGGYLAITSCTHATGSQWQPPTWQRAHLAFTCALLIPLAAPDPAISPVFMDSRGLSRPMHADRVLWPLHYRISISHFLRRRAHFVRMPLRTYRPALYRVLQPAATQLATKKLIKSSLFLHICTSLILLHLLSSWLWGSHLASDLFFVFLFFLLILVHRFNL